MIAVRFHGRGGQGCKTASRILGSAAFAAGFTAQDSPLYGAERRGAPVSAFTRIAKEPIRERGLIASPDVVMIADTSLIADTAARVSEGVDEHTVVFANSPLGPEELATRSGLPGRMVTMGLTELAMQHLGAREAISALLGAAAGRLVGLEWESVRAGIEGELTELGVSTSSLTTNLSLARTVFDGLQAVALERAGARAQQPVKLETPVYEPPTRGTARISAAANSILRETGGWRTFRPVLVPDQCNGCWLCFAYCPDGVISMNKDDRPVIDYDHCKGCQICVHECPTKALVAEREQDGLVAWHAK